MKRVYISIRTTHLRSHSAGDMCEIQLLALGAVVKGRTFHTYILPTCRVSRTASKSHGIARIRQVLYHYGTPIPNKEILSPVTALGRFWRFLEQVLVPSDHDPLRDQPIPIVLVGENTCYGFQRAKVLCYNIIRFKVPCPKSMRIRFAYDTISLMAKTLEPTVKKQWRCVSEIPLYYFLRSCHKVKTRVYGKKISDVTALDEAIAVKELISGIGEIKNESACEVLLRVKPTDWTIMYSECLSQVRFPNREVRQRVLKRMALPVLDPLSDEDQGAISSEKPADQT
ncbi:hypothetical protein TCAL_13610 [Tigriopus californicus]|uniref:Uncharacterized protein n=2 Tax=Tigriopus californicus TaxID=6832 RepID=A0A553PK28_TIGCA|nr:hypothetical protein TCAL_13610 [Tigriopus californicus]|eukprot:TCALIF_13610-PA protein Name:"Protein of unknown function" AED:0.00 eAED:0.00 QI:66/1/1/1/1/1/2/179/283